MGIRVNWHGQERAREMVEHGKIREGPFEFGDADRARMLGREGADLEALSAHHLAIDDERPGASSRRFRYPIGKEGHVYTDALRQVRNQAHAAGHTDVRDAASSLLGQVKASYFPAERSGRGAVEFADYGRCSAAGASYERHMRRRDHTGATGGGAARDPNAYRQRIAALRLVFPSLPVAASERLAKQGRFR
jgi:hypothetical protein